MVDGPEKQKKGQPHTLKIQASIWTDYDRCFVRLRN